MTDNNFSLNSLIQVYKTLDESKLMLEEMIDNIGHEHINYLKSLPADIQNLVEITLRLTPEQRTSLMRFIESLKSD
ncbi:MAG: hypothetical protein AB7V16_09480 [Vulcanibacillus sp.]